MEGIDINHDGFNWGLFEALLGEGYDFKGKNVVEIGCGTGVDSISMAKRGASVTFLDMEKKALEIVRKSAEKNGVKAEYLHGNAFEVGLKGFDIAHSGGLVEHFLGEQRQEIIDVHTRAVKKGGKVVLFVPNAKCPPYRIGKAAAQLAGNWPYGNEYPYTKSELKRNMERSGLRVEKMIGGELLFGVLWAFLPLWVKSKWILMRGAQAKYREGWAKLNYNNFLANRVGRVIGAIGEK